MSKHPVADSDSKASEASGDVGSDALKKSQKRAQPVDAPFSISPYIRFGLPSVETFARAATVFGFALYVLGLLIANVYLYQIGVSDFSVVRARFVLTGALALLTPVPIALFIVAVVVLTHQLFARDRPLPNMAASMTKPTSRRLAGVNLLGLVLIAWLIVSLSDNSFLDLSSPLWDSLGFSFLIIIFLVFESLAALIMTVFFLVRNEYDKTEQQVFIQISTVAVTLLVVGIVVLAIFVYIEIFAASIYPIVPEQFGGAKPKQVDVFFSQPIGALGPVFLDGEPLSEQLVHRFGLIWETEQSYVVRDTNSPESSVYQIDRKMVDAIRLVQDVSPAAASPDSPGATRVTETS